MAAVPYVGDKAKDLACQLLLDIMSHWCWESVLDYAKLWQECAAGYIYTEAAYETSSPCTLGKLLRASDRASTQSTDPSEREDFELVRDLAEEDTCADLDLAEPLHASYGRSSQAVAVGGDELPSGARDTSPGDANAENQQGSVLCVVDGCSSHSTAARECEDCCSAREVQDSCPADAPQVFDEPQQPLWVFDGRSRRGTAAARKCEDCGSARKVQDSCFADTPQGFEEPQQPLWVFDGRSRRGTAAACECEDCGSARKVQDSCLADVSQVFDEAQKPLWVFGRSSESTAACERGDCCSAQDVHDSCDGDTLDDSEVLGPGQAIMVFDGRSSQGGEQPDRQPGSDEECTDIYSDEGTDMEAAVPLYVFDGRQLAGCSWHFEASEPSECESSEFEAPDFPEYESLNEATETETPECDHTSDDAPGFDSAAAPFPSLAAPTPDEQQLLHQPYRVRLDSGEMVLRTFEPSDPATLARDRHLLPPRALSAEQAEELQQCRRAAKVAEAAMADALLDELWGHSTLDEAFDAALATSGVEVPCTAAYAAVPVSATSATPRCQFPALDCSFEQAANCEPSIEATEPCSLPDEGTCQLATPAPACPPTEELCSGSLECPQPGTEAQPAPQQAETDVKWGAPVQLPANWADLEEEALLQEEGESSPGTAAPSEPVSSAFPAGASASGQHNRPALQDRDHCLLRSSGQLPWDRVHPNYEVELSDGTRTVRRFEASPMPPRRCCRPPPAPPADQVAKRSQWGADMRRVRAAWRAWRSYAQQRAASRLMEELMGDCSLEQSMDRAIATARESTAAQPSTVVATPAHSTSQSLPVPSASSPAAEAVESVLPTSTPQRAAPSESTVPCCTTPPTSQSSSPGKKQHRFTFEIQCSPASAEACPAWPSTRREALSDAHRGEVQRKGKRSLRAMVLRPLRCAAAALGFFTRPVSLSRASSLGAEE